MGPVSFYPLTLLAFGWAFAMPGAAVHAAATVPARITFLGEKTPISCEPEEGGQGYFCEQGGRTIVVYRLPEYNRPGLSGAPAFAGLATGRQHPELLEELIVEEIRQGDELIYGAARSAAGSAEDAGGMPLPFEADSLISQQALSLSKYLFSATPREAVGPEDAVTLVRTKGGARFEAALAELRKSQDAAREELRKAMDQGAFTLELSDGRKVDCLKGKNRAYSETERDAFRQRGESTPACGILKCGPLEVKGKRRELGVILVDLGLPIVLVGDEKEGFVDALKAKALRAPGARHPMVSVNPAFTAYLDQQKASPRPGAKPLAPYDSVEVLSVPDARQALDQLKSSCAAPDPAVDFFDRASLKFREGLALRKVVQWIDADAAGFRSRWGQASEVGRNYCREEDGIYLSPAALAQKAKLKTYAEPRKPQTITRERAEALFQQARAMDDLAWGYQYDGCYARAHLLARRFEAQGIEVGKAWIMTDSLRPASGGNDWSFHVAPVVYVEGADGGVERWVIDPSVAEGPLSVKEWSSRLKKDVVGPDVEVAFPPPDNNAAFERRAIAFSSSEPYLMWDPLNWTEEKKQALATETLKQYRRFVP